MERLIERSRAGNAAAFTELTRRFQNRAFAYAVSQLGDFQLAEDAVQESFIAAYYGLNGLRDVNAFPGWLRGIVRHECARIRRSRPQGVVPVERAEAVAAIGADPALLAERSETSACVLAAVMALPIEQRDVVVLYYLRDHSQKEIAHFLDLPIATVNNRLHAARLRLRRKMGTLMSEVMTEKKLTEEFAKRIGRTIAVRGPLVDIACEAESAPQLFDGLSVESGANLHIVQRLGAKISRCIAAEGANIAAGADLNAATSPAPVLTDTLLAAAVRNATMRPSGSPILETGIKVIDLLSPLAAGGSLGLFGSAGVGKGVLTGELVRRLAADPGGLNLFHLLRPMEIEGTRHMVRVDTDILGATDRIGSLETYWLVTERATDPVFASGSDTFDAAVFCSSLQAARGIWPAIDPLFSRSRLLTPEIAGEEHVTVAARVRDVLTRAKELTNDPIFLEYVAVGAKALAQERAVTGLEERLRLLSVEDRLTVDRARKISAFFGQPFFVAEAYTKQPGATVPLAETIAVCRDLLDGKYDAIPHTAFQFAGGIEDVLASAVK